MQSLSFLTGGVTLLLQPPTCKLLQNAELGRGKLRRNPDRVCSAADLFGEEKGGDRGRAPPSSSHNGRDSHAKPGVGSQAAILSGVHFPRSQLHWTEWSLLPRRHARKGLGDIAAFWSAPRGMLFDIDLRERSRVRGGGREKPHRLDFCMLGISAGWGCLPRGLAGWGRGRKKKDFQKILAA